MSTPVIAPVRPTFQALATTIVPEATRLTTGEWLELEAIVEDYLSRRPEAIRRQLRLFVRLLAAVQDAPILLLRRGFWGLRTMVYLGYYSRAEAAGEIGYRANVHGWEARR